MLTGSLSRPLVLLCLFSLSRGDAPPEETCSGVEEWLKKSELTGGSRQRVLEILKQEEIGSVKDAVESFETLKARDSYKKLPLGAARVLEKLVKTTQDQPPSDPAQKTGGQGSANKKRSKSEGPAQGWMSLVYKVQHGDTEGARELLFEDGESPNSAAADGKTVLMMAAGDGHTEIVEMLLEKDVTVDQPSFEGWTALMFAALTGHTEIVQALLQRGARYDKQSEYGTSALMAAAQNGHTECVRLLLDYGANVELESSPGISGGMTALMFAAEKGHTEAVKALLKKGAGKTVRDVDRALRLSEGITFGGLLSFWSRYPETTKLLKAHRNKLDDNGLFGLW